MSKLVLGLPLLLVVSAEAHALRVARFIPPIERYCSRGKTWNEIERCIKKYAPKAKQVAAAKHARMIESDDVRYMFVDFDDGWQYGWRVPDANYELLSEPATVKGARRFDVRRHLQYPNIHGTLDHQFEHASLVCPIAAHYCQLYRTTCTVMSRGKAIETFIGTIAINTDLTVLVDGDRSQTTSRCR